MIASLTTAATENKSLLTLHEQAADKASTENQNFRNRNFPFAVRATIDELDKVADEELGLDKLQLGLAVLGAAVSYIPLVGQFLSVGIDLLNASISLAVSVHDRRVGIGVD